MSLFPNLKPTWRIIQLIQLKTKLEMLISVQVQYHSIVPSNTAGKTQLNGNIMFQQASWFLCIGKMLKLVIATHSRHMPCKHNMKTNKIRKSKTVSWTVELMGIAKPGDNVQQVCKQPLEHTETVAAALMTTWVNAALNVAQMMAEFYFQVMLWVSWITGYFGLVGGSTFQRQASVFDHLGMRLNILHTEL